MLQTQYLIGLLMFLGVNAASPSGYQEIKQNDNQEPHLLSRQKRLLMKSQYLWPNAIIPYVYEDSALSGKYEIEKVMGFIESQSCVRFIPSATMDRPLYGLYHQANQTFYQGDFCTSTMGFSKSGSRTSCCTGEVCLDSIGHVLGFSHEDNNPKRDGWIEVNMDVLPDDMRSQYVSTSDRHYNYSRPYDISSVMHTLPTEYTKGKPAFVKSFPELSVGHQYFYFFKEITEGYKCYEKPQCESRILKCANDGYQTILHGKCRCNCPTGLDPDNLCKTPLKKAVTSQWPRGQYALLKPKSGCPNGGFFQSASVIRKGPDGNAMSSPYDMEGQANGTLVELHFCTRTMKDNGFESDEDFKFNWPLGNYCIYQMGDRCPEGFDPRSIEFDHSLRFTYRPTHIVTAWGMTLCCQNRGFLKAPASFPSDEPFVLIKYPSEECQIVTGMRSILEFHYISNSQAFKVDPILFSWLSNGNKFITVPICYYRPVDMECGGSITLSSSHPEITISMSGKGRTDLECTWVVKGDTAKGTLVLDFEDFNVKKQGNNCADKVEVRHAMIGQFGQEYCGEVKHSIRSITDKLLVRFLTTGNSDSSFTAKIKWITYDDMCYDVENRGVSYDGGVNYTRTFQPCLPWAEMTECPYHPFLTVRSEQLDTLEGNACRNPDNSFRPWCYTDKAECQRNYCDVCGLEKPYDKLNLIQCKKLKDQGFCTSDPKTIKNCAATCYDQLAHKPLERISCPLDYTLFNDTCIGFAAEAKRGSYAEAVDACWREGGIIAAPKSQEEANFISKLVFAKESKFRYAWIGINDVQTEGKWVYEDQTDVIWTNWDDNEPNSFRGLDEDAALMGKNTKWLDMPNYGINGYPFACSVPKSKNRRRTCLQPTPPEDGEIIGTLKKYRYNLGDTVQYKCSSTHSVVTSRCMTSGQWSNQDSACRACPPGYTLFKNTCYGRSKGWTKGNIIDAVKACRDEGGVVATPKSQEEANIIRKIVGNQEIWIGISDTLTEGRWLYLDETAVVWTNWDTAEPNNVNNEDFAFMKSSTKWIDIQWNAMAYFVCSFPELEYSTCLDILGGEGCGSLLTNRPSLCRDYPNYASNYCRKSCNMCLKPQIFCFAPVPRAEDETVGTNKTMYQPGETVEYKCKWGPWSVFSRCMDNGQWSKTGHACLDCRGTYFKGFCYTLIEKAMNYDAMVAHCETIGGNLAAPRSQEEANFIANNILVSNRGSWVGITDRTTEGRWVYKDGTPIVWRNWNEAEPNNRGSGGEHCAITFGNTKWTDVPCLHPYYGVCAKKL